jgi:GTP-binding protein LepA
MRDPALIRNFCIIAHIDHGKSTLADRFIEKARVIDQRKMQDQMLDNMDIERERGITIKSQAVALEYLAKDGKTYTLNLVDTPGHVDFSYEVSRAISSCEGALLLIDATQGVEAQTLSNMYMALEHDLEIIPVINKIDMPAADPEEIKRQIEHDLGLDPEGALAVSGRYGTGVDELFEAIVARIPAPKGTERDPLQALIFDSHYDPYRGVVVHLRVMGGSIVPGQRIRLMYNGSEYNVEETGKFRITLSKTESLSAGEVGYIIAGIKTVSDVRVGDTLTDALNPAATALPGFR